MKINTKTTIKNLAGKEVQINNGDDLVPWTIGDVIANILISSQEGGKMKMLSLAQDFYNKDEVSLDAADLALVKHIIDISKIYDNNLATGQILLYLENLKEE